MLPRGHSPSGLLFTQAGAGSLNVHQGSGVQINATVSGGSFNKQFNAKTIHYTESHPAAGYVEEAETPPKPSSNVPFHRDPDFVERAVLSEQIRAKLSNSAGRVALVGLGGVGKSQLAIEYARQVRQRSPQTWVLWVHASSAARFDESVCDVVNLLKIRGRRDPNADLLQLLQGWLRGEGTGTWLIVLDNADDADFLLEQPTTEDKRQGMRQRLDYLMSGDHGSMLITTRNKSEALKLVYHSNVVEVSSMTGDEAEALLVGKLGNRSADDRRLVRALDCIPLAITQAAAYIRERTPRCSTGHYCEVLEQSRKSRTSLLRRHIPLPDRDAEASNSIILTWQISFEHVYKTHPSAAELLSLMSFSDRFAIPEVLLRADDKTADYPSDSSDFEDDIVTLRNFSFVSMTADSCSWTMHRLVQDATQVWLEDRGRAQGVLARFIHRLCMLFLADSPNHCALCRTLLPHALSIVESNPSDEGARAELALLMHTAARYAHGQADYSSGLKMAVSATRVLSAHFGEKNEVTLWSQALIASIFRDMGRLKEAEQLEVSVTKIMTANLGPENPSTLSSMANLASTYRKQGRLEEAEQLAEKVLEITTAKLGHGHLDTLISMNDLAATYFDQGQSAKAEHLFAQVVETSTAKLCPNHPVTLSSMANLALTYRDQGRWEKAEQLGSNVSEIRRVKLGSDHPGTLISMNNLATMYFDQGRWREAEQLFEKVVVSMMARLGSDHPDTLTTMANLASAYRGQGRLAEAEQLEVKVVELTTAKLDLDHPNTLTSMANLATTYRQQQRLNEAEEIDVKVVKMMTAKLGPDHQTTLTIMANLASDYREQGRLDEAEQLEVEVIEIMTTKLGPNHQATLTVMANLATTYRRQGRLDEAEQLKVKVMQIRTAKMDPGHPSPP